MTSMGGKTEFLKLSSSIGRPSLEWRKEFQAEKMDGLQEADAVDWPGRKMPIMEASTVSEEDKTYTQTQLGVTIPLFHARERLWVLIGTLWSTPSCSILTSLCNYANELPLIINKLSALFARLLPNRMILLVWFRHYSLQLRLWFKICESWR